MARWSFLLAILLAVNGIGCAVNPGFRTAFTSKALDEICQVGVPILVQELESTAIPDVSGSAGSPIGTIDYSLTSIKISEFQIPTSSLVSSSSGLTVAASGITLYINADWSYREESWPHLEDHGSCDVSVDGTSLGVTVTVGADSKGHATLSASNCNLNIGSLKIDFHGGASWLYNLFSGYIADQLKSSLDSQLCSTAIDAINTQGNAALESLPVIIQIDKTSEIDYALLGNPLFTSTYIQTQHKGEFFNIAHPQEAPFSPPPLPGVSNTSQMLYLWLTDYVANTAGLVYQQAGLLTYNINPDMVPSSFPFHLNTDSFKLLVPELYKKFPNWPMMLDLNATKPPLLTFSPSGGNLTVFGQVLVYVVEPNDSSVSHLAFVLGMTVYADAKVLLKKNGSTEIIAGNATFLKVAITLDYTIIGQFNVDLLQNAANLVCTAFVIPTVNHYIAVGIPIPTVEGISLVSSSIEFGQGYVMVSSDFNYTPTYWSG